MSTKIESLSLSYVNAYNANDETNIRFYVNEILDELSINSWQLKSVKNYYLVSKALFYTMSEAQDCYIDNRKCEILIISTYYSLLKCIKEIRNNDDVENLQSQFSLSSAYTLLLITGCYDFILRRVFIGLKQSIFATSQLNDQIKVLYWNVEDSIIKSYADEMLNDCISRAMSSVRASMNLSVSNSEKLQVIDDVYSNIESLLCSIESTFEYLD